MHAQAAAQQKSAKETVDEFCNLEASGKWFVARGEQDLTPLLLDARTSSQSADITLAEKYSVHDLGFTKVLHSMPLNIEC